MHELVAYTAFLLERSAVCKVRGLEKNILKGSNACMDNTALSPHIGTSLSTSSRINNNTNPWRGHGVRNVFPRARVYATVSCTP
jgi:hypothetical protein